MGRRSSIQSRQSPNRLGKSGRTVLICDLINGQTIHRWPELGVGPMAFRPDRPGSRSLENTERHVLSDCGCRNGQTVRPITLPINADNVAWGPDGFTLATACSDSKIYLWEAATGMRKAVLEGASLPVMNLSFNSTGTLLASNGPERRLGSGTPPRDGRS